MNDILSGNFLAEVRILNYTMNFMGSFILRKMIKTVICFCLNLDIDFTIILNSIALHFQLFKTNWRHMKICVGNKQSELRRCRTICVKTTTTTTNYNNNNKTNHLISVSWPDSEVPPPPKKNKRKKKRTCRRVDCPIPADLRIKLKESGKRETSFLTFLENWKSHGTLKWQWYQL